MERLVLIKQLNHIAEGTTCAELRHQLRQGLCSGFCCHMPGCYSATGPGLLAEMAETAE
jgi:hypothetical protein